MKTRIPVIAVAAILVLNSTAFGQTETIAKPALISNFAELVTLLADDSVSHQTEANRNVVMIPTEKGPIDSKMVIRWAETDGYVHFIQPMTIIVPDDRIADVESAIARMNHGMPNPGLGLNHDIGNPYFRMTIPIMPQNGLTAAQVRSTFSRTLTEAAHLQRTIKAVVDKETAAKDVISFHQQLNTGIDKFPVGKYARKFTDANWSLSFESNGKVVLMKDDQEMVQSHFKARGATMVLSDPSGPLAVEGNGVYTWKLTSEGLVFRMQADETANRAKLLLSGVWKNAAIE